MSVRDNFFINISDARGRPAGSSKLYQVKVIPLFSHFYVSVLAIVLLIVHQELEYLL